MITITLRDKNITCKLTSPIYQYENNVEQIKCLIPKIYNSIDLTDATVTLVYEDENGIGGFIELEMSDEEYNKEFLQCTNMLNTKITKLFGTIKIFLKINEFEKEFSLETNQVTFPIIKSKELPKVDSEKSYSYLDQVLIKINQMNNKSISTLREATNQANIARKEANKTIDLTSFLIDGTNGGDTNV